MYTERGHVVDYHLVDDDGVALLSYGEWVYDNLVLFAPQAEDFAGVDTDSVVAFINGGGNVVMAVSADVQYPPCCYN